MRYELGDKVRIKKILAQKKVCHTTSKNDFEKIQKKKKKFYKYTLVDCDETGFIVGIRSLKISTTLIWTFEDSINFGVGSSPEYEGVRQRDSEHISIYLVATRMNCFRRVNQADIELLEGVE
ncbi:hypothetical protein MFLO_15713 [Listeria floridensis FSL S10-1187]|uniref:Uncharacterized protein n=1 Tax=Listeria floridensis FSL S10-1187 TaxID=1265817 RepID=A0ABN0RBC3_9LIST|nr:hypothetical protein [Listeria floridensis]EUJ24248.1 hypothetical protein MFLO_15713 [Listeria floridensis FSL S10-1187]